MYKKHEASDTDLKNIMKILPRFKSELANETDSERSKWLVSKLETYRKWKNSF